MSTAMELFKVKPIDKNVKLDGMNYTDVVTKYEDAYTLFDIKYYENENNLAMIGELIDHGIIAHLAHRMPHKKIYKDYLVINISKIKSSCLKDKDVRDMIINDIGFIKYCAFHEVSNDVKNELLDTGKISSNDLKWNEILFYREWA